MKKKNLTTSFLYCFFIISGCHKEPSVKYYLNNINEAKNKFEQCKQLVPDERYETSGCYNSAKALNKFYWDKAPNSLQQ